MSATTNCNCERQVWLYVSICANVIRHSCSLPYIPHLNGMGGVVSAAIASYIEIVTRVSSCINVVIMRYSCRIYSAYNANERRGECGYSN